uniref:non-specific serine/threonine protein kinase n=1 Tax=Solanum tuberosum TaxID=4113 RepID=M1DU46_SOLTU
MVYRADMNNGDVIAVKKLWPITMTTTNGGNDEKCGVRDSFSAEVKTLGSIRHKNIVRFLGCCWNRSTRLLMYDYMPNGSLGSLLHEREEYAKVDVLLKGSPTTTTTTDHNQENNNSSKGVLATSSSGQKARSMYTMSNNTSFSASSLLYSSSSSNAKSGV